MSEVDIDEVSGNRPMIAMSPPSTLVVNRPSQMQLSSNVAVPVQLVLTTQIVLVAHGRSCQGVEMSSAEPLMETRHVVAMSGRFETRGTEFRLLQRRESLVRIGKTARHTPLSFKTQCVKTLVGGP